MQSVNNTKTNDNIPWVEKYRPTEFGNIVLDNVNRILFENILKNKYFPTRNWQDNYHYQFNP